MSWLILEPYYGGSHRRFVDDLRHHVLPHARLLELPARKWKWRMRTAAIEFSRRLKGSNDAISGILASPFLDLATFRGLVSPRIRSVPTLVYWHENQFAYPSPHADERDFAFLLMNITTFLAADHNIFNSQFNRDTFFEGAREFLRNAPDVALNEDLLHTAGPVSILPVPLDLVKEPLCHDPRPTGPPLVTWNHRWDQDKNPEMFARVMERLDDARVDFRLAILGEQFRSAPAALLRLKEKLGHRIETFGYVADRTGYLDLLRRSTIVISCAHQEFQGLALLEALAQGADVLAPRRLSYPEFLPAESLYDDESDLEQRLVGRLRQTSRAVPEHVIRAQIPSWSRCHATWQRFFASAAIAGV